MGTYYRACSNCGDRIMVEKDEARITMLCIACAFHVPYEDRLSNAVWEYPDIDSPGCKNVD